MTGLDAGFFARSASEVAPDLVGCELRVGGCAGVIVETEAYDESEPACHGFGGMTPRNEAIFGPPGRAYVYLSYGIHSLLNAVAGPEGRGAAVLIRALEPTAGVELMRERRRRHDVAELCSGPGKLAQALGVGLEHDGRSLGEPPFELRERCGRWKSVQVTAGPRVGITKAVELPWRHCAAGSRFVSSPRPAASRVG